MATTKDAMRRCRQADIWLREEFGERFGRRFDDLLPERVIRLVDEGEALHAREGRACQLTKETRLLAAKRKARREDRRRSKQG